MNALIGAGILIVLLIIVCWFHVDTQPVKDTPIDTNDEGRARFREIGADDDPYQRGSHYQGLAASISNDRISTITNDMTEEERQTRKERDKEIFKKTRQKTTNSNIPLDAGDSTLNTESRKWRVYKRYFDIAGTSYRQSNVEVFLSHVERSAQSFGISLEREPNNRHDSNAIKVFGWMNRPANRLHIGYVPADFAEDIAENIPTDIPISAEYVKYREGESAIFIQTKFLIPSKNDPIWQGRFPESA